MRRVGRGGNSGKGGVGWFLIAVDSHFIRSSINDIHKKDNKSNFYLFQRSPFSIP